MENKCIIQGCSNIVSAFDINIKISGGGSKTLCIKHRKYVSVICPICNKSRIIKSSHYYIEFNGLQICSPCSLRKIGNNEQTKNKRSNNMIIYNNNLTNLDKYKRGLNAAKATHNIIINKIYNCIKESNYSPSIELNKDEIDITSYIIYDKFLKIPGVYALYGCYKNSNKNLCIDVAQSNDIGKEIKSFIRKLFIKNNIKQKIKYKNIIKKFEKLKIKIINTDICLEEERLTIEAFYAKENNALIWRPEPDQFNKINKFINIVE